MIKVIWPILFCFWVFTTAHALCSAGLSDITYGYENSACADDAGRIRQIHGILDQCPDGFMHFQDKYGRNVCRGMDGKIIIEFVQ